ncbi:hypothetical protein EDB89DRAFT_1911634 [Lactarius sanguifluus]|nr:hypothetical protein EDB89DRAFT_1911634 [Lactarius sanguifluus]
MAPMRRGQPNAVGGDGRAGVVVAVEAMSRWHRWSGVEAGSVGGTVVARWQWRSCRGSQVGGVEVGAAAMLRWQGQGRGAAGAGVVVLGLLRSRARVGGPAQLK